MAVQTVLFSINLLKWGNSGISDFSVPTHTTNPTWPDLLLVYVLFVRSVYISVRARGCSNCNLSRIVEPLVADFSPLPL